MNDLEVSISLVTGFIRKTLSLNGVLLLQYLVAGESLHHADVPVEWRDPFYTETLIPGHKQWSHIIYTGCNLLND